MSAVLDHIVIGAAELSSGVAWMTEVLQAEPVAFGSHALMSTHNALWRMEDCYLEVIAIDPDAPDPGRKRWYGLDLPEVQKRLTDGPKLLTWVIEPGDFEQAVGVMPTDPGEVVPVTRDALSWRLTVPSDGSLPLDGAQPTLIAWDEGSPSPRDSLPEQNLRLDGMILPEDTNLPALLRSIGLQTKFGAGSFAAVITAADGEQVVLE